MSSEDEDITITRKGNFLLFKPRTDEAREWLEENHEGFSDGEWYNGALIVREDYALEFERRCREEGDFLIV